MYSVPPLIDLWHVYSKVTRQRLAPGPDEVVMSVIALLRYGVLTSRRI